MNKWTSYEKSVEALVDSFASKAKVEYVNLFNAQGRILAQDIVAEENSPKTDTSEMDGYAIKYEDQDLQRLKLVSTLPAGTDLSFEVGKGECIKTFTGSLMSEGADTLIPIENVEVDKNCIIIKEKVRRGFAVRPKGEAYSKGDVIVKKGSKIGFGEIGTFAEIGLVQVPVFTKPRVAILATGDEIVDIGESVKMSSQIRSSNHAIIYSIAQNVGADPMLLGVVGDDKGLIKRKILEGLEVADIVVTTGGVSVGDYDFVKEAVKEVGVEHLITGAGIKPGRHIRVVKVDEKYIIALPGFPYSSTVGFYLYGVRLIEYMLGVDFERRFCEAIIDEEYQKRSKFFEFSTCNLLIKDGALHVNLKGKIKGSSAIVTNLLNNAALLCIQTDKNVVHKNEKVKVLRLGMEI